MKQFISSLFLILSLLCTMGHAGTYLPLDSRLYDDLKYLEAEGVITTSQLATLPISRVEGARLTKEAFDNTATDHSSRVTTAISRLQKEFENELKEGHSAYLTPIDSAEVKYLYSDREGFFAQKNRDGDEVRRGSNVSLNLTSRFDGSFLGAEIKPQIELYEGAAHFTFIKAYLLANWGREEFMFGRESAWWGPGQNGSTLLSSNADPLTALKISNSTPYFPFGIGVRATFFVTKLESDRKDVRKPILNGIRLDLKPAPWIELGLSKTAIYGGEGRSEDAGAFLDSVFVVGENEAGDPGDQRAGFDVKVVLPWRLQPVTLYADVAGEDQRNHFPEKWFGIVGVYLPRVMNLDRLELLGEFANNTDSYYKGMWYTHHTYTQGYTYNGRIIGHYMGSDAKDLFLQARYNFDAAQVSFSYERLRKTYPEKYTWENYQGTALAELTADTDLTFSAGFAREEESNALLQIGLKHHF